MAFEQTSVQDRRPQPGLALNLSANNNHLASNNPFRRNISPAPRSSGSFTQSPPITEDRRISTNPFLDSYKAEVPASSMPSRRSQSPQRAPNGLSVEKLLDRPVKQKNEGVTEKLLDLSLTDEQGSRRNIPGPHPHNKNPYSNPSHRTTHSNEEKNDFNVAEKAALDIFESPGKTENRKPLPRRNSDSSMFDARDEEHRRRERRRREREREGRTKEGRDGKSRSHRTKRPGGLDIIDKLDVTGLYGPGMIHHDGPFDACNPHRNRKNARAAPMHAFPAGSLNNVLGGAGPVNKGIDYDAFHGRVVEGFSDYNKTSQLEAPPEPPAHSKKPSQNTSNHRTTTSWDAKEKIEPVHGEATAGLGTSTFFEGTTVSRKDIQRRESESENTPLNPGAPGDLSRKRSIAQKIRGISKRPSGSGEPAALASPEGRTVHTPTSPQYVQSAGGRDRMYERNPFFHDHTSESKKGPLISTTAVNSQITATATGGRPRTASSPRRNRARAPSSPRRDLYRPATQEDEIATSSKENGNGAGNNTAGGLIGRVKSLRGKKRPERFGGANA